MRFEKLNDNKIRIILNSDDLIKNNIDFHSFMSNPIESQSLFLDMLNTAEKEIGFSTQNYNIKIEAIQVSGGDFVLTITRSVPDGAKNVEQKKKLHVKRKKIEVNNNCVIYNFNTFDDFCNFSNFIKHQNININNIAKSISLYEYKDTYYLIFFNINLKSSDLAKIFSSITEFGSYVCNANLFNSKLAENGKIIMKNNAVATANKYFS